VKKEKVD